MEIKCAVIINPQGNFNRVLHKLDAVVYVHHLPTLFGLSGLPAFILDVLEKEVELEPVPFVWVQPR